MNFVNIMSNIFGNNLNLLKNFSETTFRLMEIYKYVLAQWRFMGDSTQEAESKKLYEFMQTPRYMEKAMKQIFKYRPSEEQFDKYDDEGISPLEVNTIFRYCQDLPDDKFSFNKYENFYRFSVCDLVEFKKHSSMDIIVFTRNYDAVVISTSLTSR